MRSADFTGTAFAGPGYDYGIRFGKQEDGKYKFGVTAGFSPLVGAAGGFDVTVDPDKLQQSVQKAIDALNPFGPDQMNSPRSMAQDDPNYDGPTDSPVESQMDSPRSRAQNDPNYDGPTDSPAKTQMNSPRSQAQDDPGYDGPTDSPADAPGESQMNSPRSQAQDDPGYDGPTDSPADPLGESQMNSPRSQSQDDPNYDGPTDSISDAAISSNTVDSETDMASLGDTMTGAEASTA